MEFYSFRDCLDLDVFLKRLVTFAKPFASVSQGGLWEKIKLPIYAGLWYFFNVRSLSKSPQGSCKNTLSDLLDHFATNGPPSMLDTDIRSP